MNNRQEFIALIGGGGVNASIAQRGRTRHPF
jgi:hypothetical protein